MDWLKVSLAIAVLIGSQVALKYGNGLLASVIAAAPVIAIVTYLSSSNPQKMALQLAVFMFIGCIAFLTIYLLPPKFFYLGILAWFMLSIFVYKFVFRAAFLL